MSERYTDKPGQPYGGAATPEHPFVVTVKPVGESNYAGNALSFESIEDAHAYARDLLWRWLGAEDYRVVDTRTGEVVS